MTQGTRAVVTGQRKMLEASGKSRWNTGYSDTLLTKDQELQARWDKYEKDPESATRAEMLEVAEFYIVHGHAKNRAKAIILKQRLKGKKKK